MGFFGSSGPMGPFLSSVSAGSSGGVVCWVLLLLPGPFARSRFRSAFGD